MFLRITRNFFQNYKELEGKDVQIGEWQNAAFAREKVIAAHKAYFQMQVQVPETCYQEPESGDNLSADELI
jgi:inorganic pyrophosphatase